MKRCPQCRRDYYDDSLSYCLEDGVPLVQGSVPSPDEQSTALMSAQAMLLGEPVTAILPDNVQPGEGVTGGQTNRTESNFLLPPALGAGQKSNGFDKRFFLAALIVALIMVSGFVGYRLFKPAGSEAIDSIAVLPFENHSGNADSEYLSDGLAESLILRLSQIPNLKVSPTSSAFRYKGKETDAKKIADDLGVEAVMTGRMTQRGDNLTITVELVDARNNRLLWGEQYERKLSELLATQSEMAAEITSKLQLKLSGEGEQKLTKKYTSSPEAYQFYLKGRFLWNKRRSENILKAIEQFKLATDRDPNFALAFAGLADCYALLPDYAGDSVSDGAKNARTFAERAIAIDDKLAEPHATLGILNMQAFSWGDAEREAKRAVDIDPNYPTGMQWYASILLDLGRYDEAAQFYQRAYELDPLSGPINDGLINTFQIRNEHDRAVQHALKFIELDPSFPAVFSDLGLSYLKLGRNDEAISSLEKAVELSGRESWVLGNLGYAYAVSGKKQEALALLEELKSRYPKAKSGARYLAAIFAGLGEKDLAFTWLEKELEDKGGRVLEICWAIPFESLRDDSRFKNLLKRMNVPE